MARQRNANRYKQPYNLDVVAELYKIADSVKYKHTAAITSAPPDATVYTVAGFVVTKEMKNLCDLVSKEAPGIKFVPNGAASYCNIAGNSFISAAGMAGYFEGDPYVSVALMYIDSEYVIESRTINNNRYKCDSHKFYSSYSKTADAAVKAFRKYFRRVTPQEVAHKDYKSVTNNSAAYLRDLDANQSTAMGTLIYGPAFISFIRALVQGATPSEVVTKPVMERAAKFIEAVDVVEDARSASKNFLYVQVVSAEKTTYSVVPFDETTTKVSAQCVTVDTEEALDEMFPGSVGRIAVLAMTDKNTFVNGVGMRAQENCFWVVR